MFPLYLESLLLGFLCGWATGQRFETTTDPSNLYCPDPTELSPFCICHATIPSEIILECSDFESENQLNQVFTTANFPYKNVMELIIRDNQHLKYLSKDVFGLVTFQNITFENVAIEYIDGSVFTRSQSYLKQWKMSDCNLVPQGFPFSYLSSYAYLVSIYLDNAGELDVLPPISAQALKNCQVTNSGMRAILNNAFYDSRTYLINIDMTHNNLTVISGSTFNGLWYVETIDLTDNKISHLEIDTFRGLSNLKRLSLGHNALPNILYDILGNLPDLETLEINDNVIRYIERDLLSSSPRIKNIIADNNQLTALEAGSFNYLRNGFLSINSNLLTTLNENWLRTVLESGSSVSVSDNLLECDCDMAWLYEPLSPMTSSNLIGNCKNGIDLHDLDSSYFTNCSRHL